MKKRNILIIFYTIIVIIISITTTTAFLTDEVGSNNNYTTGNVKISLDEANVNELGEVIDDTRTQSNDYHLMPGYTYKKDPTITVLKNSTDSYVRILITINGVNELKEVYGDNFRLEDIYNNWGENWYYQNEFISDDNEITYEYRYNLIVNALNEDKKLEPIFESFTIPTEAKIEQLEKIQNLEITIIGQAVQAEGFENVDKAWESFNG